MRLVKSEGCFTVEPDMSEFQYELNGWTFFAPKIRFEECEVLVSDDSTLIIKLFNEEVVNHETY